MNFLFGLLFRLPGWLFLVLAGIVCGAGFYISSLLTDAQTELRALAQSDPPEFTDHVPGQALDGEVALRLTLDFDNAYRFFYGMDYGEDFVEYFLFLESDDAGNAAKTFEGVVLFESYERAEVDAWFERITLEETETTSFVELRGFAKSTDLLNLETDDAMYNLNARPTADFVYIRPFLGGRDAYYAAEILVAGFYQRIATLGSMSVAGLLTIIAIAKMLRARKRRSEPAGRKPASKLAVASASYGVASKLLNGDEENESDESDDFGLAFSAAKSVFGFIWKRRQRQKAIVAQSSAPVEEPLQLPEETPQAVPSAKSPSFDALPTYTPPTQEFLPEDLYDALVAKADAQAKALSQQKRLMEEQMQDGSHAA